uniref:Uncharacterized protein n=1 Tax=Oryza sativa subsp. japonica TaxID=39947 RepID=Q6Z3B0_ORYSJ|nr:hypothetical protein [Oryza sativa Japonica Group]
MQRHQRGERGEISQSTMGTSGKKRREPNDDAALPAWRMEESAKVECAEWRSRFRSEEGCDGSGAAAPPAWGIEGGRGAAAQARRCGEAEGGRGVAAHAGERCEQGCRYPDTYPSILRYYDPTKSKRYRSHIVS